MSKVGFTTKQLERVLTVAKNSIVCGHDEPRLRDRRVTLLRERPVPTKLSISNFEITTRVFP